MGSRISLDKFFIPLGRICTGGRLLGINYGIAWLETCKRVFSRFAGARDSY